MTVPPGDVAGLRTTLRGEVIQPSDGAYDSARTVYNAMIDRRPRLIARCADAADVRAALEFAQVHELPLAVRGGGHSGPGLAVCDDGLVVDLSGLRGVRVDPEDRTVRAGGGCTLGDLDHATHTFGLAVPGGVVSTTGVGGLTLGGGHGYLTRKHGLTVDNLLEADLVLADGRFVTVGPGQNEDLFWAIRGGGGNFGVVTSFLFRAHPVHTVQAGVMFWSLDDAGDMLRWYRDFMPQALEDLYGFYALMIVPPVPLFPENLHGRTVGAIVWCHLGSAQETQAALAGVRRAAPPLFEQVGPMPFPALQTLFDPLLPPGLQWHWKGDFLAEIPDEAIARHIEFAGRIPTPLSTMHMYPIDGAASRVAQTDAAFSYRDVKWSMVIAGIDPDPANAESLSTWARDYWSAVHPYSAGGAYVNFMMEEGAGRVQATYRGNYERLAAIKERYDPTNLFRINQNIPPAR